jgi:hypothetical protein
LGLEWSRWIVLHGQQSVTIKQDVFCWKRRPLYLADDDLQPLWHSRFSSDASLELWATWFTSERCSIQWEHCRRPRPTFGSQPVSRWDGTSDVPSDLEVWNNTNQPLLLAACGGDKDSFRWQHLPDARAILLAAACSPVLFYAPSRADLRISRFSLSPRLPQFNPTICLATAACAANLSLSAAQDTRPSNRPDIILQSVERPGH